MVSWLCVSASFAPLARAESLVPKTSVGDTSGTQDHSTVAVGGRFGYANAWTNGSPNLGLGIGVSAAYRTASWHVLELDLTRYFGAQMCAQGPQNRYCVESSAFHVDLGLGHRFRFASFFVEPHFNAGFLVLVEGTVVSGSRAGAAPALFAFGPSVALGVAAGHFTMTAQFESYATPARIASPSMGVFGHMAISL